MQRHSRGRYRRADHPDGRRFWWEQALQVHRDGFAAAAEQGVVGRRVPLQTSTLFGAIIPASQPTAYVLGNTAAPQMMPWGVHFWELEHVKHGGHSGWFFGVCRPGIDLNDGYVDIVDRDTRGRGTSGMPRA